MEPDLDRLEAAVARRLDEERGPLASMRTWPHLLRFLAVVAGLAALLGFFWAVLLRADLDVYPMGRWLAVGGAYLALALAAAWLALRPIWQAPLPAWAVRLLLGAAVAAPVVAALLPEQPTHYAVEAAASARMHARYAFYCLATGTLSGSAVLLVLRLVDRSGRVQLDAALLASLLAGLAGVTALHLECPINYPVHLILGHAAVPLIFAGVSRLFGGARG